MLGMRDRCLALVTKSWEKEKTKKKEKGIISTSPATLISPRVTEGQL